LWAYEIDDTVLATTAPVTPLPAPAPSVVPDAADLVQPRTKPVSKEDEEKK
jgi:hypothetical protein